MTNTRWTPTSTGNLVISTARLQGEAWAAWNASYHTSTPDIYRAAGLALYQQAIGERIQSLFARLDEQNAQLDEMARPGTRRALGREPHAPQTNTSHGVEAAGGTRNDRTHGRAA